MTTQIVPPQAPATPALSEDELLNLVTRASALQQSGLIDQAIETYEKLLEADPGGRYGSLAQRALSSLVPETAPPLTGAAETATPTPAGSIRGATSIDPAAASLPSDAPAQPSRSQKAPVPSHLKKWRNPKHFRDLPIRQKQLLGLFGSELISILGLVGVGAILIVTGLRSQLLEQARSELAVTQINYNIKIDQMGFGFRGQSDNTAVINAAVSGKASPQVVEILRNEIKARKIEYATLVDSQARIIASANASRTGEVFNPNNLVSAALSRDEQIKTTEVVPWEDLAKEQPPLPEGVEGQDALIRYTVTPVHSPSDGSTIGALVSGDIVNGKQPIVAQTLDAFGGGYSAVYFRNTEGQWQLATSLQSSGSEGSEAVPNVTLPRLSLIDTALENPEERVAQSLMINNSPYTLAAQVINNSAGEPTAILVRGTPEAAMNTLLRASLGWQSVSTIIVVCLDLWIATLLTRSIAGPIRRLQQSTQKLAAGDISSRAEIVSDDEVGQLAQTFNQMADNIQARTQEVEKLAAQQQQEAEFQRRQTERLQRRVIELLLEIEGAQKGDLTVRAQVTDDEMGSVADAFNATVRSLRLLVNQVQEVSEEMRRSASDSDGSVTALSDRALQQAEAIATVLKSVEDMSRSIESVADSAMTAATIAKEASQSASIGGNAMEQTVESIEELRSSVAETSKKVKRLTESSQEISKIVALISEISAKTNLLAFNASIEAVRAGENGQGFRIVADEVRRLAERVTESTKEIEQLVSSIQLETAEVLTMMEKGTAQVVTSTRLVADTRQTLSVLVNTSQQIDQLVQTISESTASQSVVSQQVSQTMKEVATVAETTSLESQNVSQRLKQLLLVSEELQESVSQFKVQDSTSV